jgi:hypothetical protein
LQQVLGDGGAGAQGTAGPGGWRERGGQTPCRWVRPRVTCWSWPRMDAPAGGGGSRPVGSARMVPLLLLPALIGIRSGAPPRSAPIGCASMGPPFKSPLLRSAPFRSPLCKIRPARRISMAPHPRGAGLPPTFPSQAVSLLVGFHHRHSTPG